MILFQMVIQVAIGPVYDPVPEDLPNGAWVGVVASGGDPVGRPTGHGPGRAEEGLGCREIPCSAEPHVHEVTVSVNCPVEVLPLTSDAHVGILLAKA
jgi:hypothetical protein